MKKYHLLLLTVICSYSLKAQLIEKRFNAWWGDTYWEFEFKKDGSLQRTSFGHYGSTTVKGKYEIKSDTIHLLSGYKNTDGTVNEYYLLDKDGYLVDLTLLYDYEHQGEKRSPYLSNYGSRTRSEYQQKKKD